MPAAAAAAAAVAVLTGLIGEGASQTTIAPPEYIAVGCTENNRVVTCEGLGLRAIPAGIPSPFTKLVVKNNAINNFTAAEGDRVSMDDSEGVLTSAQIANVREHPTIVEIQLQGNGITGIESGTFAGFGTLEVLRLFGNRITSLQAGSFEGLVGLQSLYLNSNPLSEIVANLFSPFIGTLSELFLHNSGVRIIANNSINALQFRPLFIDMTSSPSRCALAPFPGGIECACDAELLGGPLGFCAAATAAPATAAPVTAAPTTLVPTTAAPTTASPTAAPTTASPTSGEVDRESVDGGLNNPSTPKRGNKKAKKSADDAANREDGPAHSKKGNKKAKKSADDAANREDGPAHSKKGNKNAKKSADDAANRGSEAADRSHDGKKKGKKSNEDSPAHRGVDAKTKKKKKQPPLLTANQTPGSEGAADRSESGSGEGEDTEFNETTGELNQRGQVDSSFIALSGRRSLRSSVVVVVSAAVLLIGWASLRIKRVVVSRRAMPEGYYWSPATSPSRPKRVSRSSTDPETLQPHHVNSRLLEYASLIGDDYPPQYNTCA